MIHVLQQCEMRGEFTQGEFSCSHPANETGRASEETCARCPYHDESHPSGVWRMATDLVSGGFGTLKAYLGIDEASEAVVKKRYAICASCEKNDCGQCLECRCFIGSIVRLESKDCPLGKWNGDVQPAHQTKN